MFHQEWSDWPLPKYFIENRFQIKNWYKITILFLANFCSWMKILPCELHRKIHHPFSLCCKWMSVRISITKRPRSMPFLKLFWHSSSQNGHGNSVQIWQGDFQKSDAQLSGHFLINFVCILWSNYKFPFFALPWKFGYHFFCYVKICYCFRGEPSFNINIKNWILVFQ